MDIEEKRIEAEKKALEAWDWFKSENKKLSEKYPYEGKGIDSHMKDHRRLALELESKINEIKKQYNIF